MNLIKNLLFIFNLWRPAFCKKAAHRRAIALALASLCCYGRKTITSMVIFLGCSYKIPIADYKFFSKRSWDPNDLFNPILKHAAIYCQGDYICVAADDTKIRKSGKQIPNACWQADPMGPPFQVNLIWGLRYLQMSLLVPLYSENQNTPARALPIRFISAPSIKKPGKKSTEEERQTYRILSKQKNLSTIFVNNVLELRKSMDEIGFEAKTLVMSSDGSFCNKTCMSIDDPRIILLARCRKDAKLCFKASEQSKRIYDEKKFTPEDVRKDDRILWQTKSFFYGGQWREVKYKEVIKVLWQNGTKKRPLRLIVLAPMPYIKGGKKNYRNPSYILATSIDAPIGVLIQAYLDRWQIEYNHRDEKSILGVGEAQVRNEKSVVKQPAFHVAVYSALLLANIMTYRDKPHEDFGKMPKWREKQRRNRNTCRALVGMLRANILDNPEELEAEGIPKIQIGEIMRQAA